MADALTDPTASPTAAQPVSAYMSPYTDDVLNSALKNLNLQGSKARNALDTSAFQSGAFGDARHGVESGALDKGLASAAGDLTASIKGDAFDKAMGWLNTDVDRQTNTALQNAGLDQSQQGLDLQAMGLGNSINSSNFTNASSLVNALLGLDTYDKNQNQQTDNTQYQDWLDQQNWDSSKLNEFLGFLSGAPTGSTTTTNTSSTTPDNSWASMIGSSLANIFK